MISNHPRGPMVMCDGCGVQPTRLTTFEFQPDGSWCVLTLNLCAVCLKVLANQVNGA